MEPGLFQSANALVMGLLDVPVGTALWHFFQVQLPTYTGELVSQLRILFIIAGLVVGFLVGLTGVGGGTLLTPLLIVLGVRPTVAVGTDLLYASVTKLAGAHQHRQRGSIHWNWAFYLALGSVPSSFGASLLLPIVGSRFGSADQVVWPGGCAAAGRRRYSAE